MASEMSITQNFRQLTLTLLADSVTVNMDVKMLKGQYTYSLTNNYTDLSFTLWSEDHEPSETLFENSQGNANCTQFLLFGNHNEPEFGQ